MGAAQQPVPTAAVHCTHLEVGAGMWGREMGKVRRGGLRCGKGAGMGRTKYRGSCYWVGGSEAEHGHAAPTRLAHMQYKCRRPNPCQLCNCQTSDCLAFVGNPPALSPSFSMHQCFCGMLARMHQFSDILRHAKKHSHIPHQAILGDLNTLANGVARLSPNYCNDWMRFLTLGWFEAEIWDHCLLRELGW